MFNSEETELIRRVLDLAATFIATPTWRKRAVALHRSFPDGHWEESELGFILTVAVEGNKPWRTYFPESVEAEAVEALRDRLRVAA